MSDICWTFGFARFARKTQVERSLHWLAAPTISDYFALKHLKEHVRTPPRAVLLLKRDHVTRAHRATGLLPACSESDTSQSGFREGTLVSRNLK